MSLKKKAGFTLIEVLIALFIFTIISVIMVSALHLVLRTQAATENNADHFDQIQLAFILMQRDMEQIIDRPITNAANTEAPAISGTSSDIQFTHMGLDNPEGTLLRSTLQRVHYFLKKETLVRETWPALDITHDTVASSRELLNDVTELQFQYLDQKGKFQNHWPAQDQKGVNLPRAIRVIMTVKKYGPISQLYIVPGKPIVTQK